MTNVNLNIIMDGTIGLAIIVAGIILLALSKVDAQTGIAIIAAGAAYAKGTTQSVLALKVPAPPQQVVTQTTVPPQA